MLAKWLDTLTHEHHHQQSINMAHLFQILLDTLTHEYRHQQGIKMVHLFQTILFKPNLKDALR